MLRKQLDYACVTAAERSAFFTVCWIFPLSVEFPAKIVKSLLDVTTYWILNSHVGL